MKKTRYKSKGEFNGDCAQRDQLSQNIISAIRGSEISGDVQNAGKFAAGNQEIGELANEHLAEDAKYQSEFNQAIADDGEVVQDENYTEAVNTAEEAIGTLKDLKSAAINAKVEPAIKREIVDSIPAAQQQEKVIRKKMAVNEVKEDKPQKGQNQESGKKQNVLADASLLTGYMSSDDYNTKFSPSIIDSVKMAGDING